MEVPIKLTKMSQTFAENKINNDAEGTKNECCICYNNDNSEEGNEGKLIECCSNKHILCIGCFHKSYERKCECPLCRELMYRPEIMSDVELYAYFSAKVALNNRREREAQQRQFRLAEAERQRAIAERQREIQRVEEERRRVEAERQRQQQLELIQVRKTERIQRIQVRNVELLVQRDEILGQIAINNAEIENITNLDLDAYYAMYSPYEVQSRALQPTNLISDSDSDTDDDSVEIIYEPQQPRPVATDNNVIRRTDEDYDSDDVRDYFMAQLNAMHTGYPIRYSPVARPVQIHPVAQQPVTPVARPVQQPVTPVARPVQQPVTPVARPVARPVQQPERPVQQPERPVQQPERPVQINLFAQPVARPVQQIHSQQQIRLVGEIINQSPPPVQRPVQQQRRSRGYAREKLRQNEMLVQTLNSHRMFIRYDRLNNRFIGSDNAVYPTLNSASGAHASEMGLSYTPNPWTTFKRTDGSRIDNL